ncbi:energy transducer TonB [Parasulfuritortus cantonensis]|uniref:Protein TonB n=1 Tax=Parasulfuritortus cantonensis TaxID=2528202 RepID=A0A4R1B0Y1_9PROT|nr:energy transducer TonB [Parasulfuritortus cantonensis]TCJ11652.1 energy transducer TonB [Parasulfuritortus cantonensis]
MPEAGHPDGRAGAGLSYGLLAWVLAGHAAAVWVAQASLATGPDRQPPRILRVAWVEPAAPAAVVPPSVPRPRPRPQTRPEPAPAPRPEPVLARSAPPEPAPAIPAVAPVPTPVAPPAPPAPVAVAEPAAVAPAPPRAPAPVPPAPVLQPPSYHADYLANPAPAYPALSRRLHEEGSVRLRVLVGPDGLAREIRLDAGSGFARLDDAARAAVAGWRFLPARLGDRPVAGWVVVPISFSLRR